MKNITFQSKPIFSKIFLSTLIVSFAALPVQAYEGQYSAFNNNSTLRSSINAGFRLTIPFGPTKKSEDKVKYGFQLGFRREFSNGAGWNGYAYRDTAQTFNADIVSLNFSENGFKGLSLAGQQTLIYKNGVLMAAESDNKEGGGYGWLIAGGVVLLGGAVLGVKKSVSGLGPSSQNP